MNDGDKSASRSRPPAEHDGHSGDPAATAGDHSTSQYVPIQVDTPTDSCTASLKQTPAIDLGLSKASNAASSHPVRIAPPRPSEKPPQRIGRFRILATLGTGGFGAVYLAHDEELDRKVALKVPRRDRFESESAVTRFLDEARRAAKLKHPGIVTVHDAGRAEDGTVFVVMELIEGQTLHDRLAKERLAPAEAAELIAQVADAVHYAHKQGLVHRDLKPANILIDAEGRPHVADFGLAVHEDEQRDRAGEVSGSASYMAPDQVRGEMHRHDGRVDVWALGVILYQLLAGRLPFGGKKPAEIFDEVLHRDPKPPRQIDDMIPVDLERICLKCLAKPVVDRFSTAADLAADLRKAVASMPLLIPTGPWPSPPSKQRNVLSMRGAYGSLGCSVTLALTCLLLLAVSSLVWFRSADGPHLASNATSSRHQTAAETEFSQPVDTDNMTEHVEIGPIDDVPAPTASVEVDDIDIGTETLPDSEMIEVGSIGGHGLEGRGEAARKALNASAGGSAQSEQAVALALAWLAQHQNPDGSWSFDHTKGPCQGRCQNPGNIANGNNAATGLALLPFLGAGQSHRKGKYQRQVQAGLNYLTKAMKVDANGGSLLDEGMMYGQGICANALCEAYGMTNDRELLVPAQEALNFIIYSQDKVGGGWRYTPGQPGDTSVAGWQLMALKSGKMAYLNVPEATMQGLSNFLNTVQTESGSRYGYTGPNAGTPATTAIGLLCRMYLGWTKDNPALETGTQYLSQLGPSQRGNVYYNYYATQVMHQYGGERWEKWNGVMRDFYVDSQSKDGHETGSWMFKGDDHGAERGGRLYITCLCCMTLEVYYRYLPIYAKQMTEDDFE